MSPSNAHGVIRDAVTAATVPAPPASPCIRQCCLDDADICVGCGRSLYEIKAWHVVDDAGREAILRTAAARRMAGAHSAAKR